MIDQSIKNTPDLLEGLVRFEEASKAVLKRPEPPEELEEGEVWRRGEQEVIAWVDTCYEPGRAPWYERRKSPIYRSSLWFGPCVLEGYDPAAPLFYADAEWIDLDGRTSLIIAAFDARDGRLVMLPGPTARSLWMTRYVADTRTNEQIWALDRERLAHYQETGQTTPTQLDELPGRLVTRWYGHPHGGHR